MRLLDALMDVLTILVVIAGAVAGWSLIYIVVSKLIGLLFNAL